MFYERLKLVCEQSGTTITTVAVKYLGVTSATPTGWKRGAYPRADVVIKAAKYFCVSADYLLGLVDDPMLIQASAAPLSDDEKEIQDVAALLRDASAPARSAALASVRSIVAAIDKKKNAVTSCSSALENEALEGDVI